MLTVKMPKLSMSQSLKAFKLPEYLNARKVYKDNPGVDAESMDKINLANFAMVVAVKKAKKEGLLGQ